MTPLQLKKLDRELDEFLTSMTADMGRLERREAMMAYVTGLLLDGERKSIEPLAARLVDDASEIEAMRQRLQQCVSVATWSDDEMRRRLALKLDRELPGVEAFVIDDTGFPKKGTLSVGVQRQYSGTLGRIENCQVATSLHLAGDQGSGCIAMHIFLSEQWIADAKRRALTSVPEDITFQTKPQIALAQLAQALAWGVGHHVVLGDCGYGDSTEFRDGISALGLTYLVAIAGNHHVWPPGSNPRAPKSKPHQRGRVRTVFRDGNRKPRSILEVAASIDSYREIVWRDGSRGSQSGVFAAVRVRSAERRTKGRPPGDEQWLLCEWPRGATAPQKFYLSTLPANTSIRTLVRFAKLRWRVERDYQEMKQEIGLDHFEGRSWRGFHHHATLCAVAHGFLALRRALFPPEQDDLDPADGASSAATHSDSADRNLPHVQARRPHRVASATSLAHVIR